MPGDLSGTMDSKIIDPRLHGTNRLHLVSLEHSADDQSKREYIQHWVFLLSKKWIRL
jgi:hypothetical protein